MQQWPPLLPRPHPRSVDGCNCLKPVPRRLYPCDRTGGHGSYSLGRLGTQHWKHEVVRWATRKQLGMAKSFILDCHIVWGG